MDANDMRWMANTRTHYVLDRGLKMFHRNHKYVFEELAELQKSYDIHHRNP